MNLYNTVKDRWRSMRNAARSKYQRLDDGGQRHYDEQFFKLKYIANRFPDFYAKHEEALIQIATKDPVRTTTEGEGQPKARKSKNTVVAKLITAGAGMMNRRPTTATGSGVSQASPPAPRPQSTTQAATTPHMSAASQLRQFDKASTPRSSATNNDSRSRTPAGGSLHPNRSHLKGMAKLTLPVLARKSLPKC